MLTRRCNYRCKGCNVWANQDICELETNDIKRGLDILRNLGVLEIVFSGGNPMLRDDIGEILDYASRYFITTVYDNGSIASKKLDSLYNVDFVAISLDSLNEKKNDYLKGVTGAWKNAMNSIRTLKKEGINVGVSPTISQFNLHEITEFTKYFSNLEIPIWYCLYWYDYLFKNSMFSIGKKNNDYEIKDLDALSKVCDNILTMKEENEYIFITKKTLEAIKELALTGKRNWKCKALDSFIVVDNYGKVAGCHSRESLGSIFDLPKVWKGNRFELLRKEYKQCEKCAYLCYIFYSIHSGLSGTLEILRDQWKNAKSILKEEVIIEAEKS
jgi:MoaA/NifB/PqqE/SkfB family radical SAM enzyme